MIRVNMPWTGYVKTAVPKEQIIRAPVYFIQTELAPESVFADMRLILTIAANAFSRLSGPSLTHSEATNHFP